MEHLSNFRQTLSTKEMSSVFGGASSWTCISDTSGGQCGDTRTVVTDDDGKKLSDKSVYNDCPEPVQT
ncbi:MAG: hypothetical protein LBC68_04000 [Prevotellaceae bacterium]|jgi:hypothetical protein|nr:hypothetical protein [Prevotellaceae bacterium]